MRAYVISDNHDSRVGLRLAGVPGCIVNTPEEARSAFELAEAEQYAILFVTEKVASFVPEIMQKLRASAEFPLVVEIPNRHGSTRDADYLTKYVQEAIGVKM